MIVNLGDPKFTHTQVNPESATSHALDRPSSLAHYKLQLPARLFTPSLFTLLLKGLGRNQDKTKLFVNCCDAQSLFPSSAKKFSVRGVCFTLIHYEIVEDVWLQTAHNNAVIFFALDGSAYHHLLGLKRPSSYASSMVSLITFCLPGCLDPP